MEFEKAQKPQFSWSLSMGGMNLSFCLKAKFNIRQFLFVSVGWSLVWGQTSEKQGLFKENEVEELQYKQKWFDMMDILYKNKDKIIQKVS